MINVNDLFIWENKSFLKELNDFNEKVLNYWIFKANGGGDDFLKRSQIIKDSIKIKKIFNILGEWYVQRKSMFYLTNPNDLNSPDKMPKFELDLLEHAPDLIEECATKTFIDKFSITIGTLENNMTKSWINSINPLMYFKRLIFKPVLSILLIPIWFINFLWFVAIRLLTLIIFIGGIYGGYQALEYCYKLLFKV